MQNYKDKKMTLKKLKISEARSFLRKNSKFNAGTNVFTLVGDLDTFERMTKLESSEEKMIKGFVHGGFVHIASADNGKGIVEFCNKISIDIETTEDITVVNTNDFKIKTKARNLALLSEYSGIKISKGLLLKFENVHVIIKDLEEILDTAKIMKANLGLI